VCSAGGKGSRIRLHAESDDQFQGRVDAAVTARPARQGRPAAGTWRAHCRYRETTAWGRTLCGPRDGSAETSLLRIRSAGERPYAKVATARSRRQGTRAATRHSSNFLDAMRGLFRGEGRKSRRHRTAGSYNPPRKRGEASSRDRGTRRLYQAAALGTRQRVCRRVAVLGTARGERRALGRQHAERRCPD